MNNTKIYKGKTPLNNMIKTKCPNCSRENVKPNDVLMFLCPCGEIIDYRKEKTIGECLRNNWNSINSSEPQEKSLRINIQNHFSKTSEFDKEYYIKYLWNEKNE